MSRSRIGAPQIADSADTKSGLYQLVPSSFFTLSSLVGPPIAGALGSPSLWRVYFVVGLPLCLLSAVVAIGFVRLRTPATDWRERVRQVDWIGNAWFVAAIGAIGIGLTPAGSAESWASGRVLGPTLAGFVALVVWPLYERTLEHPTLPRGLLRNRTASAAFACGFFLSVFSAGAERFAMLTLTLTAAAVYIAIYLQGARGQSVLASGYGLIALVRPMSRATLILQGLAHQLTLLASALWLYLCVRCSSDLH